MNVAKVVAVLVLYYVVPFQASPSEDPDVGLNTVQMIENHGYPWQNHIITTEDGYILTYQRIPHGKENKGTTKKPAVLLMHALSSASADFVSMGPNRGLGYILADRGYDVWIGNSRGNFWCRNHTKFDVLKDAKNFYDFSWHEVGYYDLPAAIDYILNVTTNRNLFYIGHSMGGTAFLVLASTRPEYNTKIKVASLLSPGSFMDNQSNPIVLGISSILYQLQALADAFQVYEVPFVDQIRNLGVSFCWRPEFFPLCEAVIFAFAGADPEQFDRSKIAAFLTNTPSNAALKQWAHYGQLVRNGGFSRYNYGENTNLRIYGSRKPPAYNLSKISAPVAVYYAKNDGLVNFKDLKNLTDKLPNVVNFYLVPYEFFNHLDYILAKDVVKLFYTELLKVMSRY